MSYSDVVGHISMVFDQTRNAAYAAAIRKYVTPDTVVLDVGAGLGVHGLIAAAAGARKVYLIEPEPVIHAAREVARHNGFADRVVAIQGRVEEVDLPEKVDIITSVFTGNLLYSEDLLPSLFLARDRWLKPGGKMIPDAAELVAAPVSAPRLHEDMLGAWSTPHFGLDYSPLRRFASNKMYTERRPAFAPELLSAPQILVATDLTLAINTDCDSQVAFVPESDGRCSGVMAWIRIRLGDDWLGTGPLDPQVHWTPQFMPVDPPIAVRAGVPLSFNLHRPAHAEWTWRLETGGEKRRHSTFLSQPLAFSDMRKLAPDFVGKRNDRALAVQDVLGRMDGTMRSAAIATHLMQTYPRQFSDAAAALAFVREMARKYAQ